MSLRTKLLAAVVGLNGAILLLALYVLVRSEPRLAPRPTQEALAELAGLGGALAAPLEPRARGRARELLAALRETGLVSALHVVEEEGDDPESGHRVWRIEDFLGTPTAENEISGPEADAATAEFVRARRHRNRWTDEDTIAVVLPARAPSQGHRGLVATWVPPPRPRPGVGGLYVVMVGGVILLTAVSFWLVSRLVMRPLAQITEASDRIASGDYRLQIDRRGTGDEFDRTIAAFNRMAREIAEYQGHLEDRVMSAVGRMRRAEQHLAIAQRLAATGKLASGVAHEINNPLGGMKNALRALRRGDLGRDKQREYIDLILDGLLRIEETVKKFLSFTPRRVEPRRADLAEVVGKAAGLARHRIEAGGAVLETDLPAPGAAQVYGDPHELQQVALNLLLNAADAVASDGPGHIHLRVAPEGEEVLLEVADDGRGMSTEDQARCFDLFFTTKEVGEGTGLGLAVVHTIVTNHGGRIDVESTPGQGTTFRVRLPAEPAAAGGEPEAPVGEEGAGT